MLIIDAAIAIGPIFGYIAQLKLLKQTKSLGSFSIDVCAILIFSNILRLYFWFTTGYAFNLFIQSILVIVVQLMLLQQCINIKGKSASYFELQSFWRWLHFQQYIKFILFFIGLVAIITLIFQVFTFGFYGEMVGYLSMGIQATLGIPQLMSNLKTKSVEGLSFTMIATWFLGDFFKTLYYIIQKQPIQFTMCGAIQLTVDILIIGQILNYSKKEQIYDSVKNPEGNIQT